MFEKLRSRLTPSSKGNALNQSLALVGGVFIGYKALQLIRHYYHHAQNHPQNLIEVYGHDSYALITGGSDGLGKAFAMELAEQGFNIILVARDLNTLYRVKDQILKAHPDRDVKTIVLDCADAMKGESFIDKIKKEVRNLDVSILINNVGTISVGQFHEISFTSINNIISVNVYSMIMMCKALIEKFLTRKPHKSAIINVSSLSGVIPSPYYSLNCASKAFVDMFSRSIAFEYECDIDILSLKPVFFSDNPEELGKKIGIKCITPKECVHGALKRLGKTHSTFGHKLHYRQAYFFGKIGERRAAHKYSNIIKSCAVSS